LILSVLPGHRVTTIVDHINHLRLVSRGYQSRYAETSQGCVHALVAQGSGQLPPLVAMAGLGSRATHLHKLAPHIRAQVSRVTLVDLPGHGRSDIPPDGLTGPSLQFGVVEALNQFIDEPAIVFGNSLGGFMALRHALAFPDKVRCLVLVSPGGAQMEPMALVEYLERFRLRSHRDALSLVNRVFYDVPGWLRQALAFFARRQLNARHMTNLLNSSTPEYLFTSEELAELRVPVRILWGQADGVVSRKQLEFFLGALPEADWQHPADYGHSPYMERPLDVAQRTLDFARSLI